MGSQQLYSLSWGEFGSSLTSTVQVLRGHGEMVDVTLAAGGRIFPAHKLVLSAASPLLMELLKSTHCHHPVLMLAGITASDLEALLQFVYQGEVSVDPSQLPSLLQAAHCLDIQALSPQTITAEKTMAHIPAHDSLRDMNSPTMQPMSRDMNAQTMQPMSRDMDAQTMQPMSRDMNAQTMQPMSRDTNAQTMQPMSRDINASTMQQMSRDMNTSTMQPMSRDINATTMQHMSRDMNTSTMQQMSRDMNTSTMQPLTREMNAPPMPVVLRDMNAQTMQPMTRDMNASPMPVMSRDMSAPTMRDMSTSTLPPMPREMTSPMSREMSSPLMSREMNSPLLPVRKRKRKQQRVETEGVKWIMPEGVVVERPMEHMDNSLPPNPCDDHMKEEIMDEQHCNGEPSGSKKLVSDLPVECTVCGVTLRQSRNLRRHMELIHLKVENNGKQRKTGIKDESKKAEEEGVQEVQQSVQTMTEVVDQMEVGVVTHAPGPSRLPSTTPTHIITSPPMYHSDPYAHAHTHTHTLQFSHSHETVFRQQQTELLRGAGLYADTREHCASE